MKKGILIRILWVLVGVEIATFYFTAPALIGRFFKHEKAVVPQETKAIWLTVPQGREKPENLTVNIYDCLEKAELALDTLSAGYKVDKEVIWGWRNVKKKKKWFKTTYHLGETNTLIAAIHERGGPIEVIRVTPHGSYPPGFSVDQGMKNGVGTTYSIIYPAGYVPLRIKTAINAPDGGFQEVQYSPYIKELDIPEVREAGARYVESVVDSGLALLRARNVRSQAFLNRLVSDYIPRDVAVSLALIEHIDPVLFIKMGNAVESNNVVDSLISRELVIIGLNKADSYKYAVSSAGARGMFQFIFSTYDRLRGQYGAARLIPNFVEGMNNHYNGAVASLCLFDADLARVDQDQRAVVVKNPLLLGQYLSAAYNGGSSSAKLALTSRGFISSRLKYEETMVYVMKFEKVWKALYPCRKPIAAWLHVG